MSGYWRAPELTARRFRPWGGGLERVLFTGDRCALDEEGFLYFHGRDDDVYKHRGYRVSALEVEDAAASLPGVGEVALLPPHDDLGAVLYVSGTLESGEVLARLRDRLEDHKLPDEVVRLDELPLNGNGKIDKVALRKQPSKVVMAR
jgi:acyl-coenzyme A synthetase/AMP-(fatty) acid ligase